MLLKNIKIKNFRQFKEEEMIKFATDEHSNITLILGDNTSGKSTLLQAFLWCFYGRTNFTTKDKIFNEELANEMLNNTKEKVKITIELEHKETKYIIEREQDCQKINNITSLFGNSRLSIFYQSKLGEREKVKDIDVENIMNEILPRDLSEYFFYDTERFGNITEKKDVTKAVEGLLGLTVLENTIDHLGRRTKRNTVIGTFYNEMSKQHYGEEYNLNDEIKKADDKISSNNRLIEGQEIEKENFEQKIVVNQEKLASLAKTMNLQKEIDAKRRMIGTKRNELSSSLNRYIKDFQNNTVSFLLYPLLQQTNAFLHETEVSDEYISGMDSKSIKDIVTRGYCVCGTEISKDSNAYAELKKTLKYLPPQSLGMTVSNHKKQLQVLFDNCKHYYPAVSDTHSNIVKLKYEINQLDQEIDYNEKEIKGVEDGKSYQREVDNARRKISTINNTITRALVDNENQQENIKKYAAKIEEFARENEKNNELLNLIEYAETVEKWFSDDYSKKHGELRGNLESKVNEYFKEIYHGNRRVQIEEDYKVKLYSTINEKEVFTDESAGLETVKNFSFIAGLVELAKSKLDKANANAKAEDIDLDEGEIYPLVLDAPFSNVDETHVVNISRVLPTVVGQLVLIVMEKDWNYATESLKDKVGETYYLDKVSEVHTKIR